MVSVPPGDLKAPISAWKAGQAWDHVDAERGRRGMAGSARHDLLVQRSREDLFFSRQQPLPGASHVPLRVPGFCPVSAAPLPLLLFRDVLRPAEEPVSISGDGACGLWDWLAPRGP